MLASKIGGRAISNPSARIWPPTSTNSVFAPSLPNSCKADKLSIFFRVKCYRSINIHVIYIVIRRYICFVSITIQVDIPLDKRKELTVFNHSCILWIAGRVSGQADTLLIATVSASLRMYFSWFPSICLY